MSETHYATFWGHLTELRDVLIRVILTIVIGLLFALFFYQPIFSILTAPLNNKTSIERKVLVKERLFNRTNKPISYSVKPGETTLLNNEKKSPFVIPPGEFLEIERTEPPHKLILLSPTEGVVMMIKVSFWLSLILTSPIWLYFIITFFTPALEKGYQKLIPFFCILSFIFFSLGGAYGFTIMIPLANQYLASFNKTIGTNMWSLSHYLDYTIFLTLASGLVFELCAFCLTLVHYGIINSQQMTSKRRHMIVFAFVIAALLTPPDILTQILLAVPLVFLFELCILYAKWRERKKEAVISV